MKKIIMAIIALIAMPVSSMAGEQYTAVTSAAPFETHLSEALVESRNIQVFCMSANEIPEGYETRVLCISDRIAKMFEAFEKKRGREYSDALFKGVLDKSCTAGSGTTKNCKAKYNAPNGMQFLPNTLIKVGSGYRKILNFMLMTRYYNLN
ncbi:hypothetical protein MMA231_02465 [Asticcacaulis sp. MM231]|uniref:hypothetical protein n=1 Tax=Asticcacaulis sp. MM231 TaxID=3157666 RepID=UPI0032D56B37